MTALLVWSKTETSWPLAQEERFTRKKDDPGFPRGTITYCLDEVNIDAGDLAYAAFYEKPFLTFERLLLSYHTVAPRGLMLWLQAMPSRRG